MASNGNFRNYTLPSHERSPGSWIKWACSLQNHSGTGWAATQSHPKSATHVLLKLPHRAVCHGGGVQRVAGGFQRVYFNLKHLSHRPLWKSRMKRWAAYCPDPVDGAKVGACIGLEPNPCWRGAYKSFLLWVCNSTPLWPALWTGPWQGFCPPVGWASVQWCLPRKRGHGLG